MVEFGVAVFGSVDVEGRRVAGSAVGYSCSQYLSQQSQNIRYSTHWFAEDDGKIEPWHVDVEEEIL